MRELAAILFVTVTTLGGQMLIKAGVLVVARHSPELAGLDWCLAVLREPRVWASIAVQALGFLAWAAVLTRMQLGLAYATFGAFFYVLLALTGWLYYGERLMFVQWGGLVLVSVGVLLMSYPALKG